MSTAILPDDSVIVRMPTHTVHVDASTRAIHVREPSHSSEIGGVIRASFPLEAADRIRLMRARTGKQHLCLDLASGETLDLGEVPSTEVAMVTARAIAELTRCKIEVAGIASGLPGPSAKFTEGETYAHGFVPWRGEPLPAVPPPPVRGAPSRDGSLSISPAHADRMFQVCEALMDSQDDVGREDDPVLVAGDSRTLEMTREEAERAMARARSRSLEERVIPRDLARDESDDPTFTPASGTKAVDGLSRTDRDRPPDDVGVDGLANTVADRPIPELFEMIERVDAARKAAAHADLASDLVVPESSSASTQPDRPRPELGELSTQPDTPVDQFMENSSDRRVLVERSVERKPLPRAKLATPEPSTTRLNTELDEGAREPVFLGLLRESRFSERGGADRQRERSEGFASGARSEPEASEVGWAGFAGPGPEEMATALPPTWVPPDEPEEGLETLVGDERPVETDLAMAARPQQTPLEAVVEILRATAEALPEASAELSPSRVEPRPTLAGRGDLSED